MVAIAATYVTADNAAELVRRMLASMRHRAHNGFGIATEELATYSREEPSERAFSGCAAVGACRSKILPSDVIQSLLAEEGTRVIDGRFFGFPGFKSQLPRSWAFRSDALGKGDQTERALALCKITSGALTAAVDPLGLKPLYVGTTRMGVGFASEIRALRRIDAIGIRKITPGEKCAVGRNVQLRSTRSQIPLGAPIRASFEKCAFELLACLRRAIRVLLADVGEVCVSFSGGLDSAVTARLVEEAGCRLRLVSVAVRSETEELAHAENLADEFGWKLEAALHESDDVHSYLRRVLWLIEEPNLMKLSVAIPLHWSAEYASRNGPHIIMTGQGSDELFGGYRKFALVLGSKGRGVLEEELVRAVLNSHDVNFARDEKAVSPFPVELRSVFTMQRVVHLGLRIPSAYKVKNGDDEMRKWILRRVGDLLGLPPSVTARRKRAIQHATGVEKRIRELAKNAGKDVDSYLSDLHKELMAEENLP